jgi:hypothetical protein
MQKDEVGSAGTPSVSTITIGSVTQDVTASVDFGGTTETAITTAYSATVEVDGLPDVVTAYLLGTNTQGTEALLGSPSFFGESAIVSLVPQSFGTDPANGLFVPAFTVVCFASGTRIETPDGEVAVEDLREGQRVVSALGGTVPVIWLGHFRADSRLHPRPQEVWPVRISAGAFGRALPRRDLTLSPDHSVFVDGTLIPVRYLVNGTTIRQQGVDAITYWHVELPAHGVLLAEGLACESYLDTGNRFTFEGRLPGFDVQSYTIRISA